MGRKTFEAIGRPLDRRDNIVVTRDPHFAAMGVMVARDPDTALRLGEIAAQRRGVDEVMIIGGAEIFLLFQEAVDLVYLTEVHAVVEGNARFDKDFRTWVDAGSIEVDQSSVDEYAFTFRILVNPESEVARDVSRISEIWESLPFAGLDRPVRYLHCMVPTAGL
jgi:dihydrofolate reductase